MRHYSRSQLAWPRPTSNSRVECSANASSRRSIGEPMRRPEGRTKTCLCPQGIIAQMPSWQFQERACFIRQTDFQRCSTNAAQGVFGTVRFPVKLQAYPDNGWRSASV
jgi:hypothetical protein